MNDEQQSSIRELDLVGATRKAEALGPWNLALEAALCLAFVAMVAVLGTWLAQADAKDRPKPTLTSAESSGRPQRVQALAPVSSEAMLDSVEPGPRQQVERFVLNYLLLPFIDDTEPMRWTGTSPWLICRNDSQVLVDGLPLQEGARLPAEDFVVRLSLGGCTPAVESALEFHGAVDLVVSPAAGRLHARVLAQDLKVLTAQGWTGLTSQFTACLALHEAYSC